MATERFLAAMGLAVIWRAVFPLLVGLGAFLLGGVGPGIFGLVLAGASVLVAVRLESRDPILSRDRPRPEVSRESADRFQRLWLVALAAGVVGVATAFASGNDSVGLLALVCAAVIAVGGGVALAVMKHPGGPS